MKTSVLTFIFGIMYHSTFGCNCVEVTNACDYLNNEYSVPVVVSFKNFSTHEATLQIEKVLSDEIILNDAYHIFGDTVTSCDRSLEGVEEERLYYFGFPIHNIPDDTIGYYQCMSPFYDVLKYWQLSSCSSKTVIQKVDIFPNPIQGKTFYISRQIQNLSSLCMYNFQGQLVHQQQFEDLANESFSMPEDIVSGIYLIVFTTDRGVKYQSKLVV